MSRAAARRGVRRLIAERWIKLCQVGNGRRASKWELVGGTRVDLGVALGGGGEDWTRWGAVGKSGFLSWRCAIGGASTAEIAKARGVDERWARRMMRRLEALGAVQRREDGTWLALCASNLAEVYGTQGRRSLAEEDLRRTRELRRGSKNR